MNKMKTDDLLEQILDEFAMGKRSPEWLRIWIEKYPQYKDQLISYTAQVSILDRLQKQGEGKGELNKSDRKLVQYGMQLMEVILEKSRIGSENPYEDNSNKVPNSQQIEAGENDGGGPTSMSEYLGSLGYDPKDVFTQARLSFTLLAMFNQGLISFPSIEIRDFVADRIQEIAARATTIMIAKYLQSRTRIGKGAFCANEKPQAKVADFFEAIRKDPLLCQEDKEFWLEFQ